MAASTPDRVRRRRKEAVEAALRDGFAPPGQEEGNQKGAIREAAGRLQENRMTMKDWVAVEEEARAAGRHHFAPDWSIWEEPELTPAVAAMDPAREVRDAAFWRNKFNDAAKRLTEMEKLAEELGGLRETDICVPRWLIDARQGKRGKSVLGCLVSDIHMGEVISADEILGINAFNPDICRHRLRRYFEAACIVGQRWASDTDCEGVLLALAGDLVSGDIHLELQMTNALTSHEQVAAVVEEAEAGINHLKATYGRVHVVGAPGNHGRTTMKPTAKLYSRLSYDTAIVGLLASRYRDDKAVTFQYGPSKDQLTPVFNRTVLTTHGDKIGTRGGMGFAGPMLPIVRGSKKIEAQQASIGRRPDLIQFGHYHLSGNPGTVFANGSVPGYSEYADDLRAVVEPPQQWLYLLHSKWWLRERASIQLEEPATPAKPVVRVPARWSEAA